jgi:hypothetical protein
MFKRFRAKREERKQQAAEEKIAEVERDRKLQVTAHTRLGEARDKMLASSCAVNNKDNCFEKCTHYYGGRVAEMQWTGCETQYYLVRPKCTLWGDN